MTPAGYDTGAIHGAEFKSLKPLYRSDGSKTLTSLHLRGSP